MVPDIAPDLPCRDALASMEIAGAVQYHGTEGFSPDRLFWFGH